MDKHFIIIIIIIITIIIWSFLLALLLGSRINVVGSLGGDLIAGYCPAVFTVPLVAECAPEPCTKSQSHFRNKNVPSPPVRIDLVVCLLNNMRIGFLITARSSGSCLGARCQRQMTRVTAATGSCLSVPMTYRPFCT